MKRANNLLPLIEDMDNLRLAFWKAGKGKRHAAAVLAYQENLEANLRDLQAPLVRDSISCEYYAGSTRFVITSSARADHTRVSVSTYLSGPCEYYASRQNSCRDTRV